MSDDLQVSGSGATSVATDELFANAQQLRRLAREAASIRVRLVTLDALVSLRSLEAAGAPTGSESDIDKARLLLAAVEAQARALEFALGTAADGYGFVERFAGNLIGRFTGELAGLIGSLLPRLALSTVGGVASIAAAGGLVAGSAAGGGLGRAIATVSNAPRAARAPSDAPKAPPFSREHNEVLTNPVTASLVRLATQATGDAAIGAMALPDPVTELLHSPLAGGVGVALAARSIMGAASSVGLLDETPVRLVSTSQTTGSSSPVGYAQRLARVPDTDRTNGAQVVIERYEMPGSPDRFEVYVAGTVTFSPVADSEPFDMTSNLANAAGDDGGSLAAVTQAMSAAGIDENSPVQLTGYSQGGGTVARLAATGDYNVQGLTTFGGPTGQIPIPSGYPAVIVEHADDIVPALGGQQLNQHAVLVERDVFAGRDIPTDHAVPAHHYQYYADTARLMDEAQSDQLTGAIASLDGFTAGARSITSTAYRFERVDQPGA